MGKIKAKHYYECTLFNKAVTLEYCISKIKGNLCNQTSSRKQKFVNCFSLFLMVMGHRHECFGKNKIGIQNLVILSFRKCIFCPQKKKFKWRFSDSLT